MIYRTGRHNPALVYGEDDVARHFTPPPDAELVAVFVRQAGEHEPDARHYVRAMNATMPCCTCRVICDCGALVGTTSGCEGCMEHNGECIGADLGELLDVFQNAIDRGGSGEAYRAEIMERFGWLGRYAS